MTPERAKEILSHGILRNEQLTKDERWELIETMRNLFNQHELKKSKINIFTVLKAISEGAIK